MSTLREQAAAKVAAAELEGELVLYRPRWSLDPRNLVDDEGLSPWLTAAPILGNLADAGSTDAALGGGGRREANPAIAAVISHTGITGLYVIKAGVGVATALAADRLAVQAEQQERDARKASILGDEIGAASLRSNAQWRRRIAQGLALIGGAVPAAAAVHNVIGMRRA